MIPQTMSRKFLEWMLEHYFLIPKTFYKLFQPKYIDYLADVILLITAGGVSCIRGNFQVYRIISDAKLISWCREEEYVNPIIFGLFSPELWTAVKGLFCRRKNNGKVIKIANVTKSWTTQNLVHRVQQNIIPLFQIKWLMCFFKAHCQKMKMNCQKFEKIYFCCEKYKCCT